MQSYVGRQGGQTVLVLKNSGDVAHAHMALTPHGTIHCFAEQDIPDPKPSKGLQNVVSKF